MFNRPEYVFLPELKRRITSGTWGLGFGHCFNCFNGIRCKRCEYLRRDAIEAEKEIARQFRIDNVPRVIFFN